MSIRYTHSEVVNSISKVKKDFSLSEIMGCNPYLVDDYDNAKLLALSTSELSDVISCSYSDGVSNFYGLAAYRVALAFARIQMFFSANYNDSSWFLPSDVAIEILKSHCDSLIFADDNKKSLFFITLANRQLCDAIRYSITEGKQSNEVKQSLRYALQYILFWWSIFAMPDPVKEAA